MEIIPYEDRPIVKLRFQHTTTYQYSGPVTFWEHRFVLRPRESHYEQLEHMEIETSPNSELHWFHDIYGNVIANAIFTEPADQLIIKSDFLIAKKQIPAWVHDNWQRGEAYPVHYAGIEESASYLYRQSVYPPEVEKIRNWLFSKNLLPPPGQSGSIFANLSKAIHQEVAYQRRESPGVQSPLETIDLAKGSCRDTAVLLMEAGRCIGYATRFVSGYLESANSKVGRGSTHAWSEVYLPDQGWRGFDPSIGEPAGSGHIAVAVSHHPRGVMPISGKFESNGFVSKGMTVAIQSEQIPI